MKRLITCLAALGSAAVLPAAASAAGPPCNASFDPYAYSAQADAACGLSVYDQVSRVGLPGGGERVDYEGDRHLYVTPPGFDPKTASDSTLHAYGFPSRPTTILGAAAWDSEFSNGVTSASPPSFLVENPNVHAATVYSPNWGGYVISANNGTFTETSTAYYEPSFGGSRCSSNADVTWSGIGGFNSNGLGQEGTSHNVPGLSDHQGWYEVVPKEGILPLSLYTSTGNYIVVETAYSSGTYSGFVQDVTTGTIQPWSEGGDGSYYAGNSADAVTERPTINGSYSNLSNFGTLSFVGAEAQSGTTFNQYAPSGYPLRNGVWMTSNGQSNGTVLAQPSGMGSGGNFSVTQKSCN